MPLSKLVTRHYSPHSLRRIVLGPQFGLYIKIEMNIHSSCRQGSCGVFLHLHSSISCNAYFYPSTGLFHQYSYPYTVLHLFFSYVALPLASLTAEMFKNLEIVQNSLQTLIKCATEGPFVESAAQEDGSFSIPEWKLILPLYFEIRIISFKVKFTSAQLLALCPLQHPQSCRKMHIPFHAFIQTGDSALFSSQLKADSAGSPAWPLYKDENEYTFFMQVGQLWCYLINTNYNTSARSHFRSQRGGYFALHETLNLKFDIHVWNRDWLCVSLVLIFILDSTVEFDFYI